MQQHHGERGIEQQQDLPGGQRRCDYPIFFAGRVQPGLEFLLMRGADLECRMARHICENGPLEEVGKFVGQPQFCRKFLIPERIDEECRKAGFETADDMRFALPASAKNNQ